MQFLSTGIVAELLSRVYLESANVKPYVIRTAGPVPSGDAPGWKAPAPAPGGAAAAAVAAPAQPG